MMHQTNRYTFFVGSVLAIFFVLYSWVYLSNQGIFTSPDEQSNIVFTEQFARTGSLVFPRSLETDYLIRPRSVSINQDGQYVPGGFLGMPLIYGFIAKVLGMWTLLVAPAAISCLGLYSLYRILLFYQEREKAFVGMVLAALLTPWWYFSARGYLPNISMVSFYLMSFFVLHLALESRFFKKRSALLFIAASCFFLALAIRPISIFWAGMLLLIFLVKKRNTFQYKEFLLFFAVLFLGGGVYASLAKLTYGSYFATGYDRISEGAGQTVIPFTQRIIQAFFPFGLDFTNAFLRFWQFSLILLLPFVILFALGLPRFFQKSIEHKKYTLVVLLISTYLILYYGSWQLYDHPDASRVSIGISYMRYWVPIYLLAIPFFQEGLFWLLNKKAVAMRAIIFLSVILYSIGIIYGYQDDNLGEITRDVVNYKEIQVDVFGATPTEAIILSSRNDKLFWPEREVIHMDDQQYALFEDVANLGTDRPIYWFTDLPQSHLLTVTRDYLEPNGLVLGQEILISDTYRLYLLLDIHDDV